MMEAYQLVLIPTVGSFALLLNLCLVLYVISLYEINFTDLAVIGMLLSVINSIATVLIAIIIN